LSAQKCCELHDSILAEIDKVVRTNYSDRNQLRNQVQRKNALVISSSKANGKGHSMHRAFLKFSHGQTHGQLHYREHGTGEVPLIMLHAAPGSALMLAPLQMRFPQTTLAIDLPGMGDSDSLPHVANREPEIAHYAAAIEDALLPLNLAQIDIYGTLSGVRVALELGARAKLNVRKLVLDGIGIPKPEQLPELLEHYAPTFTPDINGTHLQTIFLLCRDQYLFYPWHARDAEHRRLTGLPSAEALHIKTMEALKSGAGFRPLIRAAFRYDVPAALSALTQPALVSTDGSTVRADLPVLEFPPAEPLTCAPDLLDKRAARILEFLAD
jgi:pimeloyl-ACP methyl ester carboxylesterase